MTEPTLQLFGSRGRRGRFAALLLAGFFALGFPGHAAKAKPVGAKAGASKQAGRAAKASSFVPYGRKVHYEKGKAIHFADFDLVYLGSRHEASDVFPNGFDYDDFDVTQGEHTITVSWTAGTGDIAPSLFKRDGHQYALELRISQWKDPLQQFGPNELLLWKDPKY